jgi:hypothetical protein
MDNSFLNRLEYHVEKWEDYRIELEKHAIESFIIKNLQELKVCHEMGINPEIALNLVR